MDRIILKSYYIIKIKNHFGIGKHGYVAGGLNGNKILLIDDAKKATRFEYFGLKGMEKSFKIVFDFIGEIQSQRKFKIKNGITVVSGDVYANINDIVDDGIRQNIILWNRLIDNEDAINEMLELSKNEDGEPTESYNDLHRFIHHAKRLPYTNIMEVVKNWNKINDYVKTELAIGYAGEMNASKFNLLMDYLAKNHDR